MKKIIVLLMLVFIGASTTIYAQESKSESRRAERKAQRDAEKAREKIEEERAYTDAVQAIKERKFVLEADRVTFKRGRSAFVTSNTNFILLNGDRASVQIAFNGAFAGPNGIGGVTVDGTVGEVKTTTDKKGNVTCNFSVTGVGISALLPPYGHPYPYRCQRDFPRRESGFPLYGRPFPQERTARATSRSKE